MGRVRRRFGERVTKEFYPRERMSLVFPRLIRVARRAMSAYATLYAPLQRCVVRAEPLEALARMVWTIRQVGSAQLDAGRRRGGALPVQSDLDLVLPVDVSGWTPKRFSPFQLFLFFPPSGQNSPTSDLAPLLWRHAFPACLAAFGTALLAPFSSQSDRVGIFLARHRAADSSKREASVW